MRSNKNAWPSLAAFKAEFRVLGLGREADFLTSGLRVWSLENTLSNPKVSSDLGTASQVLQFASQGLEAA